MKMSVMVYESWCFLSVCAVGVTVKNILFIMEKNQHIQPHIVCVCVCVQCKK